MGKGDKIIVRTPGGGGYGNPFERDLDLVLKDVRMRYISLDSARKDYGVVIVKDGENWVVDRKATVELRQNRIGGF
jgi:N-methylhydantoinase B